MIAPRRRQVLLGLGGVGLAGLAAKLRFDTRIARAAVEPTARVELPETLRVLTVAEYVTLAAACERILPRDDTPGAMDLDVPVYVDRALAERPLPGWAEGFRAGLARLDAEAARRSGGTFAQAKTEDQDALLGEFEASADAADAAFLRNLVTATLEGAFGDPAYGGNADGAGWVEIGFPVDPYSRTRMP